jgi:hypothetical protein
VTVRRESGTYDNRFRLCTRYARFTLVPWLDNWPWFCTCGNFHSSNKKTAVAAHTREIMAPPFDAALAAAVKKQEEKTKEEAPYFGARSQKDALELDAWKEIGKEWRDRAPITCWQAYAKRYPVAGARQVRYDEAAKAEVLSGERDAELKKAAAVCDYSGLGVWECTQRFVAGVDEQTVHKRLKALDYAGSIKSWAADLDAELAATKKKYVGVPFFDCDGDKNTILAIDFYEDSPTPLEPVAWCTVEGYPGETPVALAEVDDYIAGREPPEPEAPPEPTPLPPVPEPPKPPPPPRTRTQKRAAAISAAMSIGSKKGSKKRRQKKADDDAAWEAEAENDVEEDDGAFRDYVPPHEQIEDDTRPTTVCEDALRATIGDASLLDEATVQTPLERCLAPFGMKRPPKDAPVVLPGEVLLRIGEVDWTIEGDRDLTKLTRAVEIITDKIEDACGGSGRRGDPKNNAADVYLDGKHVKVKNNRNGAGCLHVVGPNDGTSSDKSRAFLSYVKRLAAKARDADDKEALEFFAAQCERWLFTRTLLVELATYPGGRAGKPHRDEEEPDLTNRHDYRHRGGEAKGFRFAGPVILRLALSVRGRRSMSFYDTRGWVATIDRSPGRGVCFVDGAHTRSRGVVEHCNDAGDAPGATLILTFRADASFAFDDMTPAERLFAHAGVALFAAQ